MATLADDIAAIAMERMEAERELRRADHKLQDITLAAIEAGLPKSNAALAAGVTRQTVYTWQATVPHKRKLQQIVESIRSSARATSVAQSKKVRRAALAALEAGVSVDEVAEITSVPRPTVRQWSAPAE